MGLFLTSKEIEELKLDHRAEDKRRYADRIKCVLMLDKGLSVSEVAGHLLLDEKSVRSYREQYETGGLDGLCGDEYAGKQSKLSDEQTEELVKELRSRIFLSSGEVRVHVLKEYGIEYSTTGITELLHRIGFSYKKPKVVPGKANKELQELFLANLNLLKEEKRAEDPMYYMDGVHPQHNSVPTHGWLPRGEETELKTNTGRERVNLNGALNAETHEMVIHESEKLNAETTLLLLMMLVKQHPDAKNIYVICDNAGYYKGKKIQEYLQNSPIKLLYLPAYSPNLNLIERSWKFFKKKVLANRYYEKYSEFKEACLKFFEKENWDSFKEELDTLLTPNFQIIGS